MPVNRGSIPGTFKIFSGPHNAQTSHKTFSPMSTVGCFPGDKAAGAWSWPLAQSSCLGYDWVKLKSQSQSQSQSYFTANHFILETSPLRLKSSNFIFQLNTCGYSPYVTSSLIRGCVCCLQFLLALASILRSESYGTHDHILFETTLT
jgi:hypothetical protein